MTPDKTPALPDPGREGGSERWRPVPEFRLLGIPRGYEASSRASVRSVPRTLRDGRAAGGVVLAQQEDKDGYATVKLGRRRCRVSVLVQLAFAGPPEVRHLDGDKSNNRPENLAWGSRWRNERDKKDKREREELEGKRCYSPAPLFSIPVTPVTGLVTLSEAVAAGVVSCSLAALRQARFRGQVPEPRGLRGMAELYDPGELARWDTGRR